MSSFVRDAFRITCSAPAAEIGGQYKQQDNGFSATYTGPDGRKLAVAGVFDGHGSRRGEVYSQLCVDTVQQHVSGPEFVGAFYANPEAVGRAIFTAITSACFTANQAELDSLGLAYTVSGEGEGQRLETEHMNKISGGSTGTLVFVMDTGEIHTFNVGDSDAWFVSGDTAQALCADHSPSSEREYERVHATWPDTKFEYDFQVACGRPRHPDGSHVFPRRDGFDGYYRKNVSGDMAAIMIVGGSRLAMTRSFGDEPLRAGGLASVPDYKCVRATESGIVRIATDGFWDNIASDDIVAETAACVAAHGYAADALNADWLAKTHAKARENFAHGRDNMWAYTITVEKNAK